MYKSISNLCTFVYMGVFVHSWVLKSVVILFNLKFMFYGIIFRPVHQKTKQFHFLSCHFVYKNPVSCILHYAICTFLPPSFFRFIIGKDLNFLVTIDSRSGKVSTAKVLDRESQFIKNSTYTVILHAVDDGKVFNSANVHIMKILWRHYMNPVVNEYAGSVHLPQRNLCTMINFQHDSTLKFITIPANEHDLTEWG